MYVGTTSQRLEGMDSKFRNSNGHPRGHHGVRHPAVRGQVLVSETFSRLPSITARPLAPDEAGHSPVRDDPVEEERLEVVVANRTTTAVVLLEPVEDRLGERHRRAREPEEGSEGRAGHVGEVEVTDVHEVFDDVQGRWSLRVMSLRGVCVEISNVRTLSIGKTTIFLDGL